MSTKRQAQLKAEKEGVEFIDDTLDQPKKAASSHYVKNADLLAEIIKSKEQDELTEEAAKMFVQIATKMSTMLKYNNPDDREDCISAAVLDCIRYWRNFDPTITQNAFAFFTSVIRNGFAKGWRSLGKIQCPDSMRVPISDDIYSL